MTQTLLELIDEAIVHDHSLEDAHRSHLGGSMIGRKCNRELWYSFRWAKRGTFQGRMLRLFNRGHKEEFRFVKYLLRVGIDVRPYSQMLWWNPVSDLYELWDWEADLSGGTGAWEHVTYEDYHIERAKKVSVELKQFRILDVDGHFGGSLDGEANSAFVTVDHWGQFIDPNEDFLLEFKTHNTKSFCKLVVERVQASKPEHWAQMQIYMHKRGLGQALYMAVNKNDDDLYLEIVRYDPAEGPRLIAKAREIIYTKKPPARIGNHPSWFDCKFCTFAKICHYGEAMEKNCRSCVHSEPAPDGQWICNRWKSQIPVDVIPVGCHEYKMITD